MNSSTDKQRQSRDELVRWLLAEARDLAASTPDAARLVRLLDDIGEVMSDPPSTTGNRPESAFDPAFHVVR